MPYVPVAVLPAVSKTPTGAPGMIWFNPPNSHSCPSCAHETSGNSAAKKISAAIGGIFLIRRGQLNRMKRNCQESFHRQAAEARSQKTELTKFTELELV